MGTPDFGAVSLEALLKDEGFDVVGVITQPDKPRGRGHKMFPPEVKVKALEYDIPVYQPESLKNEAILTILSELNPEVIVVAAYGKILPKYVLDFPRYGCINVHGSLLPQYRGSAPIQWSVINGDKTSGVTIMQMAQGVDTGDMLMKAETEIGEYETAEELFDRFAVMGGELLVEALKKLQAGELTPVPQNEEEATYAPMITKEMAMIDWNKTKNEISKLICGMNSWPVAYTYYNGSVVKIYAARKAEGIFEGKCGEILKLEKKKGLLVKCLDGGIYLNEVQFAGSKRMNIEDYLRGHVIDTGTVFGQ